MGHVAKGDVVWQQNSVWERDGQSRMWHLNGKDLPSISWEHVFIKVRCTFLIK